tara:strand:+ start:8358 stop:8813 length:456 start_codon:yes stop_codon:yes gene_type:complete
MSSDRQKVFEEQASSMGINRESFRKCIVSEQAREQVVAEQQIASEDYEVLGTPTFLVNGDKVTGKQTFGEFRLLIEAAIEKNWQNFLTNTGAIALRAGRALCVTEPSLVRQLRLLIKCVKSKLVSSIGKSGHSDLTSPYTECQLISGLLQG